MTQRNLVLRMLRERGREGVSAHELIYRHGITRGAAIIFDLRQEGYPIETLDDGRTGDGKEKMARYVLNGAPVPLRQSSAVERQPELPPSKPIEWPCGCVRAADGRSWLRRCERHAS